MEKQLLFFQWHSFMNKGMERGLKELNIAYDTFFHQFEDWEKDDAFMEKFRAKLKEGCYSCVLSVNFSPLISTVCEEVGMLYIAWVYDSPLHIRNLDALRNSCNRIYFFDRGEMELYRKLGADARYMPLAVDCDVFGATIAKGGMEKYATDVSLVGKLYKTEYMKYISPLNQFLRGYLEGMINAQSKLYGGYLLPELITDDLLGQINENYAKVLDYGFQMGRRELEFLLACEVTGRERYMALALLSKYYRVDVYSTDIDERLTQAKLHGYVDYYSEMPLVFAASKINLNISLRTIRSGIPLRVLDVMGCGGLVLSNYQEDLFEYFAPNEECVIYENVEDMYYKVAYLLEHEEERKDIARRGYERVMRDFTFKDRLGKMLQF